MGKYVIFEIFYNFWRPSLDIRSSEGGCEALSFLVSYLTQKPKKENGNLNMRVLLNEIDIIQSLAGGKYDESSLRVKFFCSI